MFAPSADSLNKPSRKRKRESRDNAIHFNVQIPLEKRQSARLANRPVEFTYADLPDDDNRSNKKFFKVRGLYRVSLKTSDIRHFMLS